jgi:membrane-bound lytic murein transglycosylase D
MQKILRNLLLLSSLVVASSCMHRQIRDDSNAEIPSPKILVAEGAPAEASAPAKANLPPQVVNAEITKLESPKNNELKEDLSSIPAEENELVQDWIDYFQGRGSDYMETYLSRSSKYVPLMKEIFRREGLPEDLVYVALIESGFSSVAKSSASAVGFWQFMRATGKRYGLQCDSYIDERRDFVKATVAAADYFKGLYNLFGSWYLAIASYNVGENRIKNLVMKYHTRDFWKLAQMKRLPKETKNYIPKFLAARMIAKDPAKYGFTDIQYMPAIEFSEIELGHSVDMKRLAQEMNIDYDELKDLNPAFKKGIALDKSGHLILRVPKDTGDRAKAAAVFALVKDRNQLKVVDDDEISFYRVKNGENLGKIAKKFHTTTRRLRALNNLGSRTRIVAGKKLKVPGDSVVGLSRSEMAKHRKKRSTRNIAESKTSKVSDRRVHVVRRGESIAQIAQHYSVSVSTLIHNNQILRHQRLAVGSRLEIPSKTNRM